MAKYTLIHRGGTEEVKDFEVMAGREMISPHISHAEFGQHDTGKVVIYEPLIKLFEAVRGAIGKPITINSGYRDPEYQAKLHAKDPVGVASPGHSPHERGAAMDLALPDGWDAAKLADFVRKTSVSLGFPMARCGWKLYHGTFVHVDLVHMLFYPYTNKANPEPHDWLPGVAW